MDYIHVPILANSQNTSHAFQSFFSKKILKTFLYVLVPLIEHIFSVGEN